MDSGLESSRQRQNLLEGLRDPFCLGGIYGIAVPVTRGDVLDDEVLALRVTALHEEALSLISHCSIARAALPIARSSVRLVR